MKTAIRMEICLLKMRKLSRAQQVKVMSPEKSKVNLICQRGALMTPEAPPPRSKSLTVKQLMLKMKHMGDAISSIGDQ